MKILSSLTAIIMALSIPVGAAQACSFNKPIFMRIADGYKTGQYTSILVARITEAQSIGEKGNDWNAWKARAAPFSDLSNIPVHPDVDDNLLARKGKSYGFSRTGSTAACDDGVGKPSTGDMWILYMHNDQVARAYPMLVAYRNDPKLQSEWIIQEKRPSETDEAVVIPHAQPAQ